MRLALLALFVLALDIHRLQWLHSWPVNDCIPIYIYVYIDECYLWSEVAHAAGSGTPAPELQCEWPPSHVWRCAFCMSNQNGVFSVFYTYLVYPPILVRQNSPEPQQAIVYASLRSMREKEGKFGHDHQYTIVYHSGSDRVRGICMIYAYICPICKADKDAGFCRP